MDTDAALRRLRDEAARQVRQLEEDLQAVFEASRDSNADDEHDPEGSTIGFERAQLTALIAAGRRRIEELDDALRRSAEGSYGRCERCGEPIPVERLEVRPFATTCVTCAARV